MPCCEMHNRLDLKLTVREYVSPACGSIKAATDAGSLGHPKDPITGELIIEGKPEYCCFECPLLLEKHANDSRSQT